MTYPSRQELEAQGKKIIGTYTGPFTLEEAQGYLTECQGIIHQDKPAFPGVCIVRQGNGYNVVSLDVEPEPWNPTENPDLDRTINLFCGTTRESNHGTTLYEGSFNGEWEDVERHIDESFQYIEGWHDGPYRVVWLSEKLLAEVTYCEGDLYLDIAQDAEGYKRIELI